MTDFHSLCLDESKPFALFGVVPPPVTVESSKVLSAARSSAKMLKELAIDGFVVYDVQDEKGRDGTERPFPFTASHEPREFLRQIREAAPSLRAVLYRAACDRPRVDFEQWLRESLSEPYNLHGIVLVGRGSSDGQLPGFASLVEAIQFVNELAIDLTLGGVTLPERHRVKLNEHQTLCEKQSDKHAFFISQVVYNADLAIMLLRDYAAECKRQGLKPRRMVFCFAPCSRKSVLRFLRWLGVEVPDGTAARILTAESSVDESVAVCVENFAKILRAARQNNFGVPIGFLCESVSRFKNDADAAAQMVSLLRQELEHHCQLVAANN